MRASLYHERERFIIWCIKHNPDLLNSVFQPFSLSLKEWQEEQRAADARYHTNGTPLPIASFSVEEVNYLYWHCPLYFVREYLHKQWGYKDNWFVKLFWKK